MNRITIIILFTLSLFGSCSEEKKEVKTSNWPQELKDKLTNDCFAEAINQLDSAKAREACNCVLEKMMAEYPDTTDVRALGEKRMKRESMKKALHCMF